MPDEQSDLALAHAREAIRQIERLCLLTVYDAESADVEQARNLLRLAVGLRRGLDKWKGKESQP